MAGAAAAKRWSGTVGRPVVQTIAGSIEGQRARKGAPITASDCLRARELDLDYVGEEEE